MSDQGFNNPFKIGKRYSLEEDGYSIEEDLGGERGVFLHDNQAVEWLFDEKLRRMGLK